MSDKNLLTDLQRRHHDARVWNAKRGFGTFLTFEMGDETEPGKGELHVWVQYASWHLKHRGHEILSSRHHASEYQKALSQLNGKSLEDISAYEDRGPGEIALRFSDGYEFRATADFENYDIEDDLISFFESDGIISFNSAAGIYREPL